MKVRILFVGLLLLIIFIIVEFMIVLLDMEVIVLDFLGVLMLKFIIIGRLVEDLICLIFGLILVVCVLVVLVMLVIEI